MFIFKKARPKGGIRSESGFETILNEYNGRKIHPNTENCRRACPIRGILMIGEESKELISKYYFKKVYWECAGLEASDDGGGQTLPSIDQL